MNYIFIVILVIILIFIGIQFSIYLKSKRMIGNPVPFDKINESILEKIKNKKSVLYFYSPTCNNCKSQTPIIEKLKKEFDSIISVNVNKDFNTAKTFRIMGTPSLLFLGTKNIERIYVGVKNENFIREKLKNLS